MTEGERQEQAGGGGMLAMLSPAARIRVAGAMAAVAALALIGLGGRCMSPTMASCSAATLFTGGPKLDVPYLGTRPPVVAAMLDMAKVRPGDYVVDLGTGDGRILIAAARERGARGLGIDIDPVMVAKAQANAERAGVADRVRFETADLFKTDLARADVVTMFLLPEVNLRLRPRLLALEPGTRIVSHAFDMGDWRPDETRRVAGAVVHFWRVPERPGRGAETR